MSPIGTTPHEFLLSAQEINGELCYVSCWLDRVEAVI
jgi:hypothetical protein